MQQVIPVNTPVDPSMPGAPLAKLHIATGAQQKSRKSVPASYRALRANLELTIDDVPSQLYGEALTMSKRQQRRQKTRILHAAQHLDARRFPAQYELNTAAVGDLIFTPIDLVGPDLRILDLRHSGWLFSRRPLRAAATSYSELS